jgi:hypothetical protein
MSDLLTTQELQEALGIAQITLYRWQARGWIAPASKVRNQKFYQMPTPERIEEIREMARQRWMQGRFKTNDRPKTAALKPSEAPRRTTPRQPCIITRPTAVVVPAGFVCYEAAVATGRDNSRFQNALGFNLLRHAELGFRAAIINEALSGGWLYHERHAINGKRQWIIRQQKPLSGEIL